MTVPLTERLTRLGEVLVALAGSPLATHVFQTLADQVGPALPADYMAICLVDSEDDAGYRLHALSGGPPAPQRTLGRHEGVAGRAMRSGRVVRVDDLGRDPDATGDVEGALAAMGLRTALVAPLRRGVQVLGALLSYGGRASATSTTTSRSPRCSPRASQAPSRPRGSTRLWPTSGARSAPSSAPPRTRWSW